MNRVLSKFISRLVKSGSLIIRDADGAEHRFGDGSPPHLHVAIKSRQTERSIALYPQLAVPEAYMDGELEIIEGDLLDLLQIAYENMTAHGDNGWRMQLAERMNFAFRRLYQLNTRARSRSNVRRHYDLSGELYRLFLDKDLQYSCAYFERPDMTLEEAQLAKKRHIAAKLSLEPGQKVLDIGSGWGGMGLYIARQFEANVLGVTLSEEQHAVSRQRVKAEKLEDRARFELVDYRALTGPFDRIVSVGMFEHVGLNHYRTFFNQVARLLADDGVMLLHTIGRMHGPSVTNPFIRKYIFPGGYIPALSEVLPAIEKAGLIVTDVEILRLHYAETLRHWRERFNANRERIEEIYDKRFARMWDFYLAGSEASFRWQDMVNFQIQITRRRDALPLTRNYMMETEAALAEREQALVSSFPRAVE
ncbi:cyclopropane-fatty-acyl-phospholipid synthase family protein [Nitratireductor sp. CH_MIT9313-5]|uniref:cyclopropane-fatty-acyl-phospholipid synthase family protein n=1 Tax=Nitratireductor sp. CH_MIT9313-5 TaxID=3107764 RepID=UPI003008557E